MSIAKRVVALFVTALLLTVGAFEVYTRAQEQPLPVRAQEAFNERNTLRPVR